MLIEKIHALRKLGVALVEQCIFGTLDTSLKKWEKHGIKFLGFLAKLLVRCNLWCLARIVIGVHVGIFVLPHGTLERRWYQCGGHALASLRIKYEVDEIISGINGVNHILELVAKVDVVMGTWIAVCVPFRKMEFNFVE